MKKKTPRDAGGLERLELRYETLGADLEAVEAKLGLPGLAASDRALLRAAPETHVRVLVCLHVIFYT